MSKNLDPYQARHSDLSPRLFAKVISRRHHQVKVHATKELEISAVMVYRVTYLILAPYLFGKLQEFIDKKVFKDPIYRRVAWLSLGSLGYKMMRMNETEEKGNILLSPAVQRYQLFAC